MTRTLVPATDYGCAVSAQPEWYERILELQLKENPEAWAQCVDDEIDEDELRLGFIYLAPGEAEGGSLVAFLRAETDYEVELHEQGTGGSSGTTWLVVGATQPAYLTLEILDEWVEWMVAAGASAGPCAFDGWTVHSEDEDEDEDEDDDDVDDEDRFG
jgi:regulator of RNase E activity RraB